MSPRVTRHIEHLGHMAAKGTGLTFRQSDINPRNTGLIGASADDGAAGLRLDPEIAADMVTVMMRVEDMGYAPIPGFRRCQDGLSLGRIDDSGRTTCRVVGEPYVIVLEDRNRNDREGHAAIIALC